jgi:hypothetical protein
MRSRKLVLPAVLAVVAFSSAFAAPDIASAETTACESTSGTGCVKALTAFNSSLSAGNEAVLTASGGLIEIKCSKSEVNGNIETTTTPSGKLSKLSFESCNNTVEVLKPGSLTAHHDASGNGTLTASGFQVRVKASGLVCTFGGTVKEGLTLTAGNPATVTATASIPLEFGMFCPASAIWHGNYTVSAPKPLAIFTGV